MFNSSILFHVTADKIDFFFIILIGKKISPLSLNFLQIISRSSSVLVLHKTIVYSFINYEVPCLHLDRP